MKKIFLLIGALLLCLSTIFAQGRLGFTNDINGGLYQVVYHRQTDNLTSGTSDTNSHIKFHNFNFRFGGSVIGTKLFEDSDSPFFIGEYLQFGLGFGMGKKSGSSGSTYNGSTFNCMLGMNIGAVASYSLSDELTVGLKWIVLGGDYYLDFDQNAVYLNGMTFHPTAQYKNYWASVGFGGKTSKEGDKYKTIDIEARYNFSEEQEESMYAGIRFQSNGFKTDEANTDGSAMYRNKENITSIGVMFGFFF